MKFIETANATYINFEEVSSITHEYGEKTSSYYSYIYLKNGTKLDFIELVDFIDSKEHGRIKLNCDHYIKLNYYALQYILTSVDGYVISCEAIENHAYSRLDADLLYEAVTKNGR